MAMPYISCNVQKSEGSTWLFLGGEVSYYVKRPYILPMDPLYASQDTKQTGETFAKGDAHLIRSATKQRMLLRVATLDCVLLHVKSLVRIWLSRTRRGCHYGPCGEQHPWTS